MAEAKKKTPAASARNRTDDRITPERLATVGNILYGEHWQIPLARRLEVSPDDVRGWAREGAPPQIKPELMHLLKYHAEEISESLDALLDEPLKAWERADELLKHYELLNNDPNMVYVTDDNKDKVMRIIADLLHYCSRQNSRVGPDADCFIDIEKITREAEALYNSEPHSMGPVERQWMTKDVIPFVLTDDPAKIAAFQKQFGISQQQAVDHMIEHSCWGEDLPELRRDKGTPAERLAELRRVLLAAGEREDDPS